jgi:predicted alpha/beta hydrolase
MTSATQGSREPGGGSVVTTPLYFGPAARFLFGWLHCPAAQNAADIGLVLCNPFGDEAIRAHRSLRHLAAEAALAGVPTLHFDYDGAGDSVGHDLEPDRLESWLASIRHAAIALSASAGVGRISFAGLRLGATLAALAAADYPGTAGLVAIAPVLNGKAYVRELRLLSKAMDAKRNIERASNDAMLETAGFLLSATTQASVSAIDLGKHDLSPARNVLVLDRAELPADSGSWVERLRAGGAHVSQQRVAGYAEMMLDSHDSVIPTDIIAATAAWLRDLARQYPRRPSRVQTATNSGLSYATLPPETVPDPVTGVAPATLIEERAVQFGALPGLFGIVSSPQAPSRRPVAKSKAILLLNSGAVHHVGPCRLYVTLARHLARCGYIVLRLDIAGIGDSPPRSGQPENVVYSRYALEDVTEAIQYLRREWGAGEVRALGLCSGAYHAFKAAAARFPLSGVFLVNPLTFFWKEGMTMEYSDHRVASDILRYRKKVRDLSSWRKLLAGKVNIHELTQSLGRHAQAWLAQPLRGAARRLGIPLQDDLPSELLHAVGAGIDLQFIFAAADPGVELLRSKGGPTARGLRSRGKLGEEHIAGADHTFTDLAARTDLASLVKQKLGV